jgi:CheY-like chemotaxis protein
VLLVEDNPVNREIAQAMLTSLGCEVDVAEEGGAAVALAGRRRYDAILMDCEMPGLDGYDATRAIRTCEAGAAGGRRVPIIALTASALDTDRRRALESGMDEHMAKPFGRDDLRRALVRWWRPVAELAPYAGRPATARAGLIARKRLRQGSFVAPLERPQSHLRRPIRSWRLAPNRTRAADRRPENSPFAGSSAGASMASGLLFSSTADSKEGQLDGSTSERRDERWPSCWSWTGTSDAARRRSVTRAS